VNGTLLALAAGAALKGRDARIRTALVAVAAGFAVALLLLAVSVPGALAARQARADARSFAVAGDAQAGRLVAAQVGVDLGADGVEGVVLAPPTGTAPLPPGVAALPPAGAMLVSPALRGLLDGPDGPLLRARLPYRDAGTIGQAGLLGPSEAVFLAVDPHLVPGGSAVPVQGFGVVSHPAPLDPILTLLLVVGVLLLLVPIGIVVAVAGRFGAERRDRRLAAFRLLGLSSREVLVVALVEAGIAAVAGDLGGLAVFALARQGIGGITIASLSLFPADVVPPVPGLVLVLLVVPLLLGAASLAGLAALRVEPLGVARRAGRRRRLRWRLVPPILAVALLALGVTNLGGSAGIGLWLVGAGIALLLAGAVAVLPWLTERIAGAVAPGPLAWQVAMRRIRHDGTTTGRVVGAITAVVAGAIALQLLFAGLAGTYTTQTGVRASGTELTAVRLLPGSAARMLALFGGSAGGPALAETDLPAVGDPARLIPVLTGDCRALARIAAVPGCHDGSVYLSPGGDAQRGLVLDAGGAWRLPSDAARTAVSVLPDGDSYEGVVLVTPRALPLARQGAVTVKTIVPSDSAVLRSTVRAAAEVDPALGLRPLATTTLSHRFDAVRRGLTVGLVLVLLLIGLVLLVSVGEQLRERRRALAVLAVLGLPRAVLARSVLAESALPVVLGTVVAAVTGAALGSALLAIVGRPAFPDPGVVLATAAVALLVPLLVTAASLPAALRLLRPEHLRTE
jgi:hypothetical protein